MDPRQTEVWALFGWLVGMGQGIEELLRALLAAGPDPIATTPEQYLAMRDKLLNGDRATMGQLITKLKEAGADALLIGRLRDDIWRDRNVLVHHYIIGHSNELSSPEGRGAILAELQPVGLAFEDVLNQLREVIYGHLAKLGKSPADVERESVEAARITRDRLRSSDPSSP